MSKILLVVSLALSLGACFSMPPPPDDWDMWKKSGVTNREDVKKAMLECGHEFGAGVPVGLDEVKRNRLKYIVKDIYVERCMEKDGFRYTSELGTECRGGRYSRAYTELPECKLPIEQIPSRDISRRLNGVYCTKFPTAELCKP